MPQSKKDFTDKELRANAEPYDWSKSRLTDDEVKEFALGIYRNEIFTEYHVREQDKKNLLGMIFLPLALGMFADNPEQLGAMEKSPPGMCYARYHDSQGRSQTLPRNINGYPIFASCAFLSREDTDRVNEKYNQIKETLGEA
jgi:hypothetical protein